MRQQALAGERRALADAEAVLLVHDRQREPGKAKALLEQCVRAHDEHGFLCGEPRLERAACPGARCPGQERHRRAGGLGEARELGPVLAREDLRGREERRLLAGLDRLAGREQGHDGLAAPHVADHEPVHGARPREIAGDVAQRGLLRCGEREWQ